MAELKAFYIDKYTSYTKINYRGGYNVMTVSDHGIYVDVYGTGKEEALAHLKLR